MCWSLKGIGSGGESCVKRQIIPDCGCKEGPFAKFSGESWTIKKLIVDRRSYRSDRLSPCKVNQARLDL